MKFPASTYVNKTVPKTAFYKHLDVDTKLKTRFVEDIERIDWIAKLAPSTLNVADGKAVHEITIFKAKLKCERVPDDVFLAIDRQMPRHILFILQYEDRYCLMLNYKEWIDKSKGTFRIIRTFKTGWTDEQSLDLTVSGSDMDKIYESFAGQLSGFGTTNAADTKRLIELQKQLTESRREIESLQKKVRTEKQFNRQLELNAEVRAKKQEADAIQNEINRIIKN